MGDTRIEYQIANGFHIKPDQGEALIQVIKGRFRGKRPSPDQLLNEARKKSSPIHNLFDWNVNRAAEQHWRERATYYLRSLEIVKVSVKTGVIVSPPVKFYMPVEYVNHKVTRYVPTQRLDDNPEDVGVVLDRFRSEFRGLINRYRNFCNFLEVYDPVIKAFERVDAKAEFNIRPVRVSRESVA